MDFMYTYFPRPVFKITRYTVKNNVVKIRFELVSEQIGEISTNAVGTDGIPVGFIKMCCPYILSILYQELAILRYVERVILFIHDVTVISFNGTPAHF
jgi:hypothetical protein